MKVAAYQAPLTGLGDVGTAVSLIRQQIERCEALGVQVLWCPEGVPGSLADFADELGSRILVTNSLYTVLAK